MLDAQFYDLIQSLWGTFAGAMAAVRLAEPTPPPPAILQLQAGQAESPAWFLIQAAEFDPEPLSVARLRVRDIYASECIVTALLEVMAAERWLDRHGDDYHLRAEGRAVLDRIRANRSRRLSALALPDEPLTRLERALRDVIDRSLAAGDPPGTWSLAHSRRRAPADDASTAEKLFQYVADVNAFRDDCLESVRDGFVARAAIHPTQVPIINEVFTPSAAALQHAKALVEAFAADDNPGVVSIDGQMYDRPHLMRAQRLLARAAGA